jgi:hypothetical protein
MTLLSQLGNVVARAAGITAIDASWAAPDQASLVIEGGNVGTAITRHFAAGAVTEAAAGDTDAHRQTRTVLLLFAAPGRPNLPRWLSSAERLRLQTR